jgi:hypothetical protein
VVQEIFILLFQLFLNWKLKTGILVGDDDTASDISLGKRFKNQNNALLATIPLLDFNSMKH